MLEPREILAAFLIIVIASCVVMLIVVGVTVAR